MKNRLGRRVMSGLKWTMGGMVGAFLAFLLLDWMFPLPPPKPYSQIALASDGTLMGAWLSPDEKWRFRTRPDQVSPKLLKALLEKEDKYFFYHPGVNVFSVGRAFFGNVLSGKTTSGASTLTMQVARMLEPKERTIWGKLKEMFRAFQLEWHYSKEEILEMYLSYVPFGGNIEGVAAASWIYFGKSPEYLTLGESVTLAVIPNRPNSLRLDSHSPLALSARNVWLDRLGAQGTFDSLSVAQSKLEPLTAFRRQVVARSPHLGNRMRKAHVEDEMWTSLDPRIQTGAQGLLERHISRLAGSDITNGAVLVVDNATMKVLAYCGSADFDDSLHSGQVDAIRAVRSPGSTLKPPLYALAMDRGLATPQTPLLDIPVWYTGFSPVNYDHKFRGQVSLEDALQQSLNLPAVGVLQQIGMESFVNLLGRAGFKEVVKSREDLGLSLALGGCGTTLEELVALYAAFAHGGIFRPLQYQAREPVSDSIRLFSPQSSWIMAEMLSGLARPDFPQGLASRTGRPKIAWKTGTSFGRRDGWAVGFTPRYTIGVWVGNMDGHGAPGLSGAASAVPLLFALFDALPCGPNGKKDWFPQPPGLVRTRVCAESGLLAGPDCPSVRLDWALTGVSQQKKCDRVRTRFLSLNHDLQYCVVCLPDEAFVKEMVHLEKPELIAWRESALLHPIPPVPHNPLCTALQNGEGPNVLVPKEGSEIWVPHGELIPFQCLADIDDNQCFWYLDGKFLGPGIPGQKAFFSIESGRHEVLCVDEKGRKSKVNFTLGQF